MVADRKAKLQIDVNRHSAGEVMWFDIALRTTALCFTLVVAVVVASVGQETLKFPMFTSTVSTERFFVVGNAIVCRYLVASGIVNVIFHYKKVPIDLPFIISDYFIGALQFVSANRLAETAGISGYWVVLSFLGSFVFIFLPLIAIVRASIREMNSVKAVRSG